MVHKELIPDMQIICFLNNIFRGQRVYWYEVKQVQFYRILSFKDNRVSVQRSHTEYIIAGI